MSTPLLSDVLPEGTSLQSGTYVVGPVLGQGGFGITYKGEDARLHRCIALKEFFPEGCTRQTADVVARDGVTPAEFNAAKARFLKEAQILARFDVSGIVRVHAIFEENNTFYLVMEYLEGQTLRQIVEERGPLAEAEALNYVVRAVGALAVVHDARLIHGDIKPDNIMICSDGRVALLDFGLTIEITGLQGYDTRPLDAVAGIGSVGYAPLEQYGRQAHRTPATDIYALAATLYHLLTGRCPISAAARAAGDVLSPPHLLTPAINAALSAALMRAMSMEVAQRPQTVSAFLQTLTASGTNKEPDATIEQPCPQCGALNRAATVTCAKCGSWLLPGQDTDRTATPAQNQQMPLSQSVPGQTAAQANLPAWVESLVDAASPQKPPDNNWWRRTGN